MGASTWSISIIKDMKGRPNWHKQERDKVKELFHSEDPCENALAMLTMSHFCLKHVFNFVKKQDVIELPEKVAMMNSMFPINLSPNNDLDYNGVWKHYRRLVRIHPKKYREKEATHIIQQDFPLRVNKAFCDRYGIKIPPNVGLKMS